jgi:MFS family permease
MSHKLDLYQKISIFFKKENTVAPVGFNRWLIPPAALAIHLSIGQVYSFSVFNIPLTQVVGVTSSTTADWSISQVTWIFSLAFFMLGMSAAVFGKWLEKVGPRVAMLISAICFSSGFMISALGVHLHMISLLYLGYGILGGVGLGIGYISPVSTLMKWFPDRPGMATGLAIMGFGGGAMIGSPLAITLMNYFKTVTSNGVLESFISLGLLYFTFMMFGLFNIRIPSLSLPLQSGKSSSKSESRSLNASRSVSIRGDVTVDNAMKTPQFWLLWLVLCTNVTAGIAVLSQASPMIQEMFTNKVNASTAAGFVGLLSIFNLVGRFVWSASSDFLGRKKTYAIYFGLGMILYLAIPYFAKQQSLSFFVLVCCLIISMYGGGFSTIPAYLKDTFGLINVGAIHGRLLTAWSTAGIVGPSLITYLREQQLKAGVPSSETYTLTMYVMVGILALGFIANILVTEVNDKYRERS